MRHIKFIFLLLSFHTFFGASVFSQGLDQAKLSTPEGTVSETYRILTGEPKKKKNWEAFRQLFSAQAQISILVHEDGENHFENFTLEEFVRLGMSFYDNKEFEQFPLKTTVNEYNDIATIFQSYRAKEEGAEDEGVNTYQLYFDGKRWWIVSLLWTDNTNGVQLPEDYR